MAQLSSDGSWLWEVTMIRNKDEFTLPILVTMAVVMVAVLWNTFTHSSTSSPPLPPGPRSLPIVGYLPFLRRDLHIQFTDMARTYGPIFKVDFGSKLHVVINTVELAKEVIRDQDETFANRNLTVAATLVSYGGQNIIWATNSSTWRNLRKIFVHEALSNKSLEASSYVRRDEVRKTIKNVFSKMGTSIQINNICFLTLINVLISMIWGNTLESDGELGKHRNLGSELLTVVLKIFDIFGRKNLSDFVPMLARFDLQSVEKDMKIQVGKLEQIIESMIEDRIKSNKEKSHDHGVGDQVGNTDFQQILLDLMNQEDGNSLHITHMKAILMDLLIAGGETPVLTIEWTMARIMRDPHVMKMIQQELTKVVGLNNIVEESHLPKLKYLDAVIKETLRVQPVVPFLLPRSPSRDCIVGGYTVPKETTVFINAWAIQRDPQYWENPLEFRPERFLDDEGAKRLDYYGNNLNYFPFGAGRRLCPGLLLADKMMMFILASLFHSFNWSTPNREDYAEKPSIILKMAKPLIVTPSQRLPNVNLYM